MPLSKRRRRVYSLFAVLLALLAADQILHRWLFADGRVLGRRVAPFDPPLFAPVQFEFRARLADVVGGGEWPFLLRHDPELGWVPRNDGPRPVPARSGRGGEVRRVVAVGCSYTYGAEVGDGETWEVALEELRPDLVVSNYGVSAYGVGQALLRLRRDALTSGPDEVWLVVVPTTLSRLEAMYRPAHRHWTSLCWFKPRFRLTAGPEPVLECVPNPAPTLRETLRLLQDQQAFVAALGGSDRWVSRFPIAYAPQGSHVAHHSGVARALLTLFEATGRPDPEEMWYAEGDSCARLMVEIVRAAQREVRAAGARFRMLVLPGRGDLRRRAIATADEGDGITAMLHARGLEVVDLTRGLLAARVAERAELWMPGGHYSPACNRLVAGLLATLE